jgi:GTP1/Obg family GTP-binding protein
LRGPGGGAASQKKLDEAARPFRSIRSSPPFHHNLGNILRKQNKLDEAIASYNAAIAVGWATSTTSRRSTIR